MGNISVLSCLTLHAIKTHTGALLFLPDPPAPSSQQQVQCDRAGEGSRAGAECRCTERDSERERKGDRGKLERDQEAARRQTQVIVDMCNDAATGLKVPDESCPFLHQVLHQGER